MVQAKDHLDRYAECRRRANWPEARYEWRWSHPGSTSKLPAEEEDPEYDRIAFLIDDGKLSEAGELVDDLESQFPGYRGRELARARQHLGHPEALFREGRTGGSDESVSADAAREQRRLSQLACLKAFRENLTGKDLNIEHLQASFGASDLETVKEFPECTEAYVDAAIEYTKHCLSTNDLHRATQAIECLDQFRPTLKKKRAQMLTELREQCTLVEICWACAEACQGVAQVKPGEGIDNVEALAERIGPQQLHQLWPGSDQFIVGLKRIKEGFRESEGLAAGRDFDGALRSFMGPAAGKDLDLPHPHRIAGSLVKELGESCPTYQSRSIPGGGADMHCV